MYLCVWIVAYLFVWLYIKSRVKSWISFHWIREIVDTYVAGTQDQKPFFTHSLRSVMEIFVAAVKNE